MAVNALRMKSLHPAANWLGKEGMSKIRKAVIPVAGLGTRFLPATKVVPKELLPIVDKPAIQYIVEEIIAAGIQEIILITGRGKQGILDYFDRSPELEEELQKRNKPEQLENIRSLASMAEFVTVWQPNPLGLGHAILCAKDVVDDEPFIVCLPDDLIDSKKSCVQQMLEIYETHHTPLIAVEKVPAQEVHQYGIMSGTPLSSQLHHITSLVEKPKLEEAPSQLGVVGRYLLPPEIFSLLRDLKPGRAGEYQLTDALNQLAKVQKILAYEFEGTRYDTGDKLGFVKANLAYGIKRGYFNGNLKSFLKELLKEEKKI